MHNPRAAVQSRQAPGPNSSMISLGIDIGGSSVKMAAWAAGKTLWTGNGGPYRLASTQDLIDAIRQAAAGRVSRADCVGLCVPGLLDRDRRMITLAVNVPGLMGVSLDELVTRALGSKVGGVFILNDVHATAYDIWTTRKVQGRLLVLALGTGVGASVLDDGVPLMVDGDSPGHIGQFDVSVEGCPVIGPDRGAGSLEGYIGGPAFEAAYGPDTCAAVARMKGDEPPLRALARGIRICHAMYRPQHVTLTGGIGTRLKHLLPHLRKLVCENLTSVARPDWVLDCGENDYHAAVGAGKLAAVQYATEMKGS